MKAREPQQVALSQEKSLNFFADLLNIEIKIVLTLIQVHVWFVFTRPDIVVGHAVSWIKALLPVSVLRAGLYIQT